ncbi:MULTISPECIES: LysE family translocator [unclassified Hahella]|uniref:LysE family translocator n=1 Tax=unclassified Hahella TaxID=2624107 RepID=UPI001C1ED03B|nr:MULTISPECIES: LysE family translocator [unclassified Hahella]MBU6950290.1 LysE family translocator [Hahella sp. HN01]MDG9666375.1 LysE family translocator [Hahella sp. CR1]
MTEYLIFLAIVATAIASPGPAVFLAVKNGAKYGLKGASVSITGNVTAVLLLAAVSALGLGSAILASATLFTIIKVLGGLYLIYLGVKAWRSTGALPIDADGEVSTLTYSRWELYREGFLTGISNPKAIAFFTALFPQFIDVSKPFIQQFPPLALTFAVCSFGFLSFYAALSTRLRAYLRKEKIMNRFNKITGGVFISFGLVMAGSSR